MIAAEPYSSLIAHLPAETPLRTNHGPTTASQAIANTRLCVPIARRPVRTIQRPLIAINTITTGASTRNDARVRHSRPNSKPGGHRVGDARPFQRQHHGERRHAVETECQALGHHEREQFGVRNERAGCQDAGQPEYATLAEDRFRRPRDRQHAERQQQRMDEQHRARIGLAFAAVPRLVNSLDDAIGGAPEPRIDPGDRRDQRRIERREEQSGRPGVPWCCRCRRTRRC